MKRLLIISALTIASVTALFAAVWQVRKEIEETDRLIRATGYRGEIHFRAPGCKKLILLPWYLRRHHRKSIIWDVEPETYPEVAADAGKIATHVTARVRPGSIVLLHVMYDSRAESRRAIGGIIGDLRAQGYTFVTVSELLAAEGEPRRLDSRHREGFRTGAPI